MKPPRWLMSGHLQPAVQKPRSSEDTNPDDGHATKDYASVPTHRCVAAKPPESRLRPNSRPGTCKQLKETCKRATPLSLVQTPLDTRCAHLRKGCPACSVQTNTDSPAFPAGLAFLRRMPFPRPSRSPHPDLPFASLISCIPDEASGRASSPLVLGARMRAKPGGAQAQGPQSTIGGRMEMGVRGLTS